MASQPSSKSKRGILVPWNFDASDFSHYQPAIDSGKITWISNWEMWKPQGLPGNVEYIPQCRTADAANQIPGYLTNYCEELKEAQRALCFMGFNEPDIADQANLDVDKAVQLWREFVLPTKAKLGAYAVHITSPPVSNGPNGLPWLKSFINALGGLPASGIDSINIHYYSPDVSHFKRYVQDVHNAFPDKPIWVTEFACTTWDPNRPASEKEVLKFMTEALSWLDRTEWVERYAWFGAMRDVGTGVGRANGLQKDGQGLSEAGKLYTTL